MWKTDRKKKSKKTKKKAAQYEFSLHTQFYHAKMNTFPKLSLDLKKGAQNKRRFS